MPSMKKVLLVAAAAVLACVLWYRYALAPVNARGPYRQTVTIAGGSTTKGIAALLRDKRLIRSEFGFLLYVKRSGTDGVLQAGKFVLREAMSVPEIVSVLRTGKAEEMIVVVPEGYTLKDIEAVLMEKGLVGEGDLADCANRCDFGSFVFLPDPAGLAQRGGRLEGYLFPDTYFVSAEEFHPKFFLERMLGTFRRKVIEGEMAARAGGGRSLHEIVTMASLIEEEAVTDAERPVIAGILWKRLDDGRGLGVDATVRYITRNASGAITAADLNVNSPYNTRKFRGLPPGPIASPGLPSIRAALEPQESEYWYYLHDAAGVIHYAVTNEEHNLNRMRYLP